MIPPEDLQEIKTKEKNQSEVRFHDEIEEESQDESPHGSKNSSRKTSLLDASEPITNTRQLSNGPARDFHRPAVRFEEQKVETEEEEEDPERLEESPGYQSIDLTGSGDKVALWDLDIPQKRRKEKHADESKVAIFVLKFAKLLTYIITFIMVLGCSFFSKVILFLMTSQMQSRRKMRLDIKVFGNNQMFEVKTSPLEKMGWFWAIFFTLMFPEILILLKSLRVCLFKAFKVPTSGAFLGVTLMETIHAVGVAMLVFEVFPKLDVIRAAMLTNSLCVVPAIVALVSRKPGHKFYQVKVAADTVCFIVQVGGLAVWALQDNGIYWTVPVAGICVSAGWWENFVDLNSDLGIVKRLGKIREEMKENNVRHFTYLVITIWKIILYFGIMLVVLRVGNEDLGFLLSNFNGSFNSSQKVNISQIWVAAKESGFSSTRMQLPTDGMLPIYLGAIHVSTSLVAYMAGKFACKICIQEFSFSLPATLTVPFTIFVLSCGCMLRSSKPSFLTEYMPKYVFWSCPQDNSATAFFFTNKGIVWALVFFSQLWATSHIWTPHIIRLAATERLFVLPMYNGALIDQSLVLNRRRHQFNRKVKLLKRKQSSKKMDFSDIYESLAGVKRPSVKNSRMKIYACATMWHETKDEMIQILKSIMRMDKYLTDMKFMEDSKGVNYDFETHIFFDDAFYFDKTKQQLVCNSYVKDLISVMNKAASYIYPPAVSSLPAPIKYITPYGGRLHWKLRGITEIIVHLKDKDKIRHKKRWSQVMYMYYLLGHKLARCTTPEEKTEMEDNTFILALDGDIDFKPPAVTRLVELMEDESLGAACGRIHPIGNGLLVWYQKFEYAVGHWLQKATEHVIGCVLCSPGCFSLFRGKALMKVMKTYASKAEQAMEYVQYDQGEDRWLCTLILKQGFRIEYSAASDAYTHCPESFGEFYTQRRRWGPSTMANIMDLLMDYKHTVKSNNSISTLYIMYQLMNMIGTILGPGTIFLMVVGAIVSALRISNWIALLCNLVPVTLFVLTCFFAKNELQIAFAQILSALYALLMMAVLVATVIQLQEEGVSSPSGIFLLAISSSFVIAALVHPYEFFCIVHGFLYFMCVPSMYLLLTIYGLINLNVVSWGTREDPVKKAEDDALKAANKHLNTSNGPLDAFTKFFSLGTISRMCNCSICTYQTDYEDEKVRLLSIGEKVDNIEKNVEELSGVLIHFDEEPRQPSVPVVEKDSTHTKEEKHESPASPTTNYFTNAPAAQAPTGDTPYWLTDEGMKNGREMSIPETETEFFREMIDKYLLPLDSSPDHEKRVAAELIALRNNVVFGFIMINSLFILIVFLLQLNKETLFITWPLGGVYNITYIPVQNKVLVEKDPLQLDPIGLVFSIFFGIIIIVQFIGMLFHRFGTLAQLLASTTLDCRLNMIEEYDAVADNDTDADEDKPAPPPVGTPPTASPSEGGLQREVYNRRKSIWEESLQIQNTNKFTSYEEFAKSSIQKKVAQDSKGQLDSRQSKVLRRMSKMWIEKGILPQVPEEDAQNTMAFDNNAFEKDEPTHSVL